MTVELWVNFESGATDQDFVALRLNFESGVRIGIHAGTIAVRRVYVDRVLNEAPALPSANAWHHVAYTFDLTFNTLYIDGVQVDAQTLPTDTRTPNLVWLGSIDGVNGLFRGKMDEVRVWAGARSAAQVQADMRHGPVPGNGTVDGLVAYWTFDDDRIRRALRTTAPASATTSRSATGSRSACRRASRRMRPWATERATGIPRFRPPPDKGRAAHPLRHGIDARKITAANAPIFRARALLIRGPFMSAKPLVAAALLLLAGRDGGVCSRSDAALDGRRTWRSGRGGGVRRNRGRRAGEAAANRGRVARRQRARAARSAAARAAPAGAPRAAAEPQAPTAGAGASGNSGAGGGAGGWRICRRWRDGRRRNRWARAADHPDAAGRRAAAARPVAARPAPAAPFKAAA